MAKCDQGYICHVCGAPVEDILDSDLYLRFVIGRAQLETLHREPECHIRCNPVLAQYIVDGDFEPVRVDGDFDKSLADPQSTAVEEQLVTRGWRRLREVRSLGLSVAEYPLPEVLERLE